MKNSKNLNSFFILGSNYLNKLEIKYYSDFEEVSTKLLERFSFVEDSQKRLNVLKASFVFKIASFSEDTFGPTMLVLFETKDTTQEIILCIRIFITQETRSSIQVFLRKKRKHFIKTHYDKDVAFMQGENIDRNKQKVFSISYDVRIHQNSSREKSIKAWYRYCCPQKTKAFLGNTITNILSSFSE
ncbi:MAG TPA: hypothetical protein VGE63_00285 [Candidatus Paceibacterota bacterium]